MDPRFRRGRAVAGALTAEEWGLARDRYPIGTVVTATVSRVWPDSCCYAIRFSAGRGLVASAAELPPVGTAHRYVVVGVLETTRRLVLTLA